MIELWESFWQ